MARRLVLMLTIVLVTVAEAPGAFAQGSANDGGDDWFDPGAAPDSTPTTAAGDDVAPGDEAALSEPQRRPAPAPSTAPDDGYADTDPRALTDFRPTLDPHGVWVDDPKYGTVWVPHPDEVGTDFAPYVTSGHWALSPEGDWIWVSDHPWGWVVFHYGRWVWIPDRGWAWVPGRQYAPAWVVWRVPEGPRYQYVGWAPMPPDYGWYGGVAMSVTYSTYYPYVFCPSAYVFSYHVHRHVVHDHHHVHLIAGHTHVYYGAHYGYGYRYGPPPALARVPPSRVPRRRTLADPRAVRLARSDEPARAPSGRGARPAPGSSGLRSLDDGAARVRPGRAAPVRTDAVRSPPRMQSTRTLRGESVQGRAPSPRARSASGRPMPRATPAPGATRVPTAPSTTRAGPRPSARPSSAGTPRYRSSSRRVRPASRSGSPRAAPRVRSSPRSSPVRVAPPSSGARRAPSRSRVRKPQ